MPNLNDTLDAWFQRHFGNDTPGTEIYAAHRLALADLKDRLTPPPEPEPTS
jgi:hypothetical protein